MYFIKYKQNMFKTDLLFKKVNLQGLSTQLKKTN